MVTVPVLTGICRILILKASREFLPTTTQNVHNIAQPFGALGTFLIIITTVYASEVCVLYRHTYFCMNN